MSSLSKGSLVQHTSLGLGKVVAVEATAVHVFFPGSDKRHAAKLRWPLASSLLRTEGLARDAWLEGLSSFAMDPANGRYALAANWLSHDDAVAEFLALSPGGFAAVARSGRPARWRAVAATWTARLGNGQGEALLADGNLPELVRRVREAERLVSRIPATLEDGGLRQALASPDAARAWFEALFDVLSTAVPGRARFEKLFATTSALGAPAGGAWPLATVFPFLAHPGREVFLLPRTARAAAERLGCDLRYDADPNWTTYATLRDFAVRLLDRLRPMGAADLVDVELFLHALSGRRKAGGRAARSAERHPRPAPRAATGAGVTRPPGRARARARRKP